MEELDKRLQQVEQNLAIFAAGETKREEWMGKVDKALFGKNSEPGIVDIMRDFLKFKNRFVKIMIWVITLIIAPLLGSIGFLTIKILAHIDQIIKLLDSLK